MSFVLSKSTRIACSPLSLCAAMVLLGPLSLATAVFAQDQSTTSTQAADNTARNKQHDVTADQQAENPSDRELARNIRKSLVADKSLSTYAHNVKIIAANNTVTLKGPVRSEDEKQQIAAKAAEVAGKSVKVVDQMTIKQ